MVLLRLTSVAYQFSPHCKHIIVAMTGASGAILGIKLLMALQRIKTLQELNFETHLVMSEWAERTIRVETDWDPEEVRIWADHVYDIDNMEAPIASGSIPIDGMIVVPCSMRTLAAISTGRCDNFITRAADVCLKEHRRLVLVTRETFLGETHLRNLLNMTRAGAMVFPHVMTFDPGSIEVEGFVNSSVDRMLKLFDLYTEDSW